MKKQVPLSKRRYKYYNTKTKKSRVVAINFFKKSPQFGKPIVEDISGLKKGGFSYVTPFSSLGRNNVTRKVTRIK